jgi:hypothetical protein
MPIGCSLDSVHNKDEASQQECTRERYLVCELEVPKQCSDLIYGGRLHALHHFSFINSIF